MAPRSTCCKSDLGERTDFFGGLVGLDRGRVLPQRETETHEQMYAGLKLVIVNGSLRWRSEATPREGVASGASVFVISDDGRHAGSQTFFSGVEQRYVVLRFESKWIASELGQTPEALHARLGGACSRPVVLRRPAERAVWGVANQILHSPLDDPLQRLQLGSQVLALAASILSPWLNEANGVGNVGLSGAELERLCKVRRLLLADLRQPPSLMQLASSVGMSMRKLDSGFRRAFGATPAQWLREQRLQHAWRWLSSGEYQVCEVAWMSGYGFAHFSTVFRRRFGLSPSDLRPR